MSITAKKTSDLVKEFGKATADTGSSEVQVAIFTHRIVNLTQHMQKNKKDFHSRRGLLALVGRRKRLLKYLQRRQGAAYKALIAKLGIRR